MYIRALFLLSKNITGIAKMLYFCSDLVRLVLDSVKILVVSLNTLTTVVSADSLLDSVNQKQGRTFIFNTGKRKKAA